MFQAMVLLSHWHVFYRDLFQVKSAYILSDCICIPANVHWDIRADVDSM